VDGLAHDLGAERRATRDRMLEAEELAAQGVRILGGPKGSVDGIAVGSRNPETP
jgi:hypothetical protein